MAKRHSAEQWEQWISEQQKSALSVRDFCDWAGVSENVFYVWRRKLATQSLQQPDSVSSLFVPLTVISNPVIEVDLPCGAVVRVPSDAQSLQRVLGILLQSGTLLFARTLGDFRMSGTGRCDPLALLRTSGTGAKRHALRRGLTKLEAAGVIQRVAAPALL